jgi:antirestriction protein ArdC
MSRNTARARTGQEERRRAAETGEDAPAIPFLRRFTVFNTDQCDGLPGDIAMAAPPPPSMIEREAERLIAATAADFRISGARALLQSIRRFRAGAASRADQLALHGLP